MNAIPRLLFALLIPIAVRAEDPAKPDPAPAAGALAAKAAEAPHAVPLKFVPVKKEKSEGNKAGGTAMTRKLIEPGVLMAMAHIGLGDTFRVRDEKDHTFFEIHMTDGDDQHLVLEIRTKDGKQKVGLVRDAPTDVKVDGVRYELVFPTSQVDSTQNAVTHQAMLFVVQRL